MANPITKAALASRRELVQKVLPELTDTQAGNFLSISRYADSIPEKFFNATAMRITLDLLRAEARDDSGLRAHFFQQHDRELATAFRSLGEINKLDFHDKEWPGFDDLRQFQIVDQSLHPAYLKLSEAVFSTLLLPIVMRERRKRGKSTQEIPFNQRVEEVERTALATFMPAFDRVIRNSIAHGQISYSLGKITYSDRSETRRISPQEVVRLFEDLLDLCNGIALAFRCFWATERAYLEHKNVSIPIPVLVEELRAQASGPSWSIDDVLEFELENNIKQLIIFVSMQFFDDLKAYYFTLTTVSAAERLLPNFQKYFMSFSRLGKPGGWASFEGTKLADLRSRGNTDVATVAAAADQSGIIIFPPYLNWRFRIPRLLGWLGTFIEVFRSNLSLLGKDRGRIGDSRVTVRLASLHRKSFYAAVDTSVVLESPSRVASIEFIRNHTKTLFWLSSFQARWNAGLSSLASFLPMGYGTVNIFLSDLRKRRLNSYGLGDKYLCRLTLKRYGQIQIIPLLTSIEEHIGRVRIDWNSNAVSASELNTHNE